MVQLLVSTALMYLPFAILCGILCFSVCQWSLQRKNETIRRLVKPCIWLCIAALTMGMIYGALRFSGILLFPEDQSISYYWFDNSWRDEGFRYLYGCGTVLVGFLAALMYEKRKEFFEQKVQDPHVS